MDNTELVPLSPTPQIVLERLGIPLTKSELLEAGKEARMAFKIKGQMYLYIDALIDHIVAGLDVPDEPSSNSRRISAVRYRILKIIIMKKVHSLAFPSDDSKTDLLDTLLETIRNDSAMNQVQGDHSYTCEHLRKHLKLFVNAKYPDVV